MTLIYHGKLINMVMIYKLFWVITNKIDYGPYIWLIHIMHILCTSSWNVYIHFFLITCICIWYFMHHKLTNQGHINKHGYDSLDFFLVIINKIDNSPYIWILCIMVDCFSFFGECSHSLHLIHISSIDILFLTTIYINVNLVTMVMIHRLFCGYNK